jgi:thymidylate kinase
MEPNLKGLIIEGTAGTGKTSVLRGLLAHPAWTGRPQISSLVLSEHHTMRVLENKREHGTLTRQDHIGLLDNIVEMLAAFSRRLGSMDWARRNRKNHQLHFVLERFHLSHLFHYESLDWEDVAGIEERLGRMNAQLCILTVNDQAMQQRITGDSTKQWRKYLQSVGRSEAEIIAHFSLQQKKLLALCERTSLPVEVIDTSELPLAVVVNKLVRSFLT